MPYTTVQRKISGQSWLDDIQCSAVSGEAVALAAQQVSALIHQRHHLGPQDEDDFNIRHPEEAISAQLEAGRTFAYWMACVAAVSLLVGGIGIMNIMLVAVSERTREIGVRLAIGARAAQIRLQFLAEAVLLSLFGGGSGICAGIGGAVLLGRLARTFRVRFAQVPDPDALARFDHVDIRTGGSYRLVPQSDCIELHPATSSQGGAPVKYASARMPVRREALRHLQRGLGLPENALVPCPGGVLHFGGALRGALLQLCGVSSSPERAAGDPRRLAGHDFAGPASSAWQRLEALCGFGPHQAALPPRLRQAAVTAACDAVQMNEWIGQLTPCELTEAQARVLAA